MDLIDGKSWPRFAAAVLGLLVFECDCARLGGAWTGFSDRSSTEVCSEGEVEGRPLKGGPTDSTKTNSNLLPG
jgi:hypothetical protein